MSIWTLTATILLTARPDMIPAAIAMVSIITSMEKTMPVTETTAAMTKKTTATTTTETKMIMGVTMTMGTSQTTITTETTMTTETTTRATMMTMGATVSIYFLSIISTKLVFPGLRIIDEISPSEDERAAEAFLREGPPCVVDNLVRYFVQSTIQLTSGYTGTGRGHPTQCCSTTPKKKPL